MPENHAYRPASMRAEVWQQLGAVAAVIGYRSTRACPIAAAVSRGGAGGRQVRAYSD